MQKRRPTRKFEVWESLDLRVWGSLELFEEVWEPLKPSFLFCWLIVASEIIHTNQRCKWQSVNVTWRLMHMHGLNLLNRHRPRLFRGKKCSVACDDINCEGKRMCDYIELITHRLWRNTNTSLRNSLVGAFGRFLSFDFDRARGCWLQAEMTAKQFAWNVLKLIKTTEPNSKKASLYEY